MLRIILIILVSFYANALNAQKQITRAIIVGGDTIPHVLMEEVIVKAKSKYIRKQRHYDRNRARLEYNVKRVYPYAQLAASKIQEIERKITAVKKDSDRRKILKKEYAELMKTFKVPLSKLSITQGRILIRLIYRETNNSAFTHIREYRGSVNAYFWQSIALIFGNNLKSDYDPYGDDREIEEIIQMIKRGEI